MENNNEFKSTYKIMDELAAKWEDLTDIQQATITELIAGKRQGNIVSSLMSNFDTARDALETSLNSSGSALEEHEKWQKSLESQILKLKASWQSLSQAFLSSDFLHGAFDAVIKLVDGLTLLIDKVGILPTLLVAFSTYRSFSGGGFFRVIEDEAAKSGYKITNIFSEALRKVDNTFKEIGLQKDGLFKTSIEADKKALNEYSEMLKTTTDIDENAFNEIFKNASNSAKEFARSGKLASEGVDAFVNSQKAAEVATLAQNKSLGNAAAIIREYYGGCKNVQMSQADFAAAVQQTNPQLATQLVTSRNAAGAMVGYTASLVGAKVASAALKVTAMALNAVLSYGIGILVSFVVEGIMSLINAKEELVEKVEELTSKFKEQHNELKKLQGDYDTTNESSMISKYEKLSKGVDHLGRNVSLTADEYSEYQSIVNQIAEQIPSLVSGYDEQGNALLSVKGNVEELTKAYEKLIHAQNNEILSNAGDIEEGFENISKEKDSVGLWGNRLSSAGVDVLEKALNDDLSEKDIKKLLDAKLLDDSVGHALKQAGVDGVSRWSTSAGVAEAIKETAKSDPQKLRSIVENFYSELETQTDGMKTIAQAKLSEAFDISSAISGLDYGNINEELQTIAYQTVAGLDFDFFNELQEQGKTVEQWTKELLGQLNTIGKAKGEYIEDAFELQAQFNGGDIDYGDYIGKLKEVKKVIDGLNLKDEAKNQLKISLGLDENGIVDQYDALLNRLTSKEIGLNDKTVRSFLDNLSVEELDVLVDIIPNLDAGITIDEIQALIDEQLAKEFKFDIELQTAGIEAFNTALTESRSAAGLTSESIAALKARYEDLEGFNAAALFEKTANGIHLNNEELSRLEEQYINTNKLEVDKNLSKLVTKYNDLTEKIKSCTDAQEKESLQLQAEAYKDKIDELSTLASQYDGLTSAFVKWQTALEGAEEGDNYDSLYENLEGIKELYDAGLVGTDKFKTAAQLMTNKDLSNADIDEIVSAYEKGYPKMQRYFTEGQKGCKNFLNDVSKLNSEWAHMNKDGSWEINFNTEEVAEELGVSVDFVLQIAKKLKDYGFEVNLKDSSVDSLQTKIEKTEAKLKKLGQSPVDINVDIEANSKNLGTIESEIEKAKAKINEINNSSVSPEIKTAQLEDAQAKLETLIDKKQEASQPAFMNLNTSQVNASLVDALEKVQAYQNAINEVNKLNELKESGITIDDSQLQTAKEKVDECAKAIQGLDGEVKMAIGLEEDGSIESIKQAFEDGKVKIDADTDPAITKIEQLAENVERIEDKDVTINVTVNGLDQVKELNKQIDLATDIQGDIDKLSEYVEHAKELNKLGGNVVSKVTADIYGNVIETPEYALNNLKVFSDSAKEIEDIGNVSSVVTAKVNTGEVGDVVDTFEYKLNNLGVFAEGAKALKDVGDVSSNVTATVNTGDDGDATDTFEYKLNNLNVFAKGAKTLKEVGGNVDVEVTAKVNTGDGAAIDEFEYKLDNLSEFAIHAKALQGVKDVDVEVNAKVNTGDKDDVTEVFEYKLNNLGEFAKHAKGLQGLDKNIDVEVNAKINTGENGDVVDTFEYKLNNLNVFAEGAKALKGVGDVSSTVTAEVNTGEGSAIDEFEYKLDNLGIFAKHTKELQGLENVDISVSAKVNTGEDGDVVDTFEYKIDNLGEFAKNVKELQDLDNVDIEVNAKVNTGEDGDVVDTFEYKLDNLGEFATHAKALQGLEDIDIEVSAKVNTGESGDVVDTFEYKLDNLGEFATHVKSLQGLENVDVTASAKVNTGEAGDVVDTFEYKLDNLGEFAKHTKELQGLENIDVSVSAKVNTGSNGDVVDTFEHKLNNLETFAKGAKALQGIGNVSSSVTAKVNTGGEGSVDAINTFEYKLDNISKFAEQAKSLQGVESKDVSITAEIGGNVKDTPEWMINNIKVFSDSAKTLDGVDDKSVKVTADVGGNVIWTPEGMINNVSTFAHSAKELQNVESKDITVNANIGGNFTEDSISKLSHLNSVLSTLSPNQQVTLSATANVDSANINQALTLLRGVADSGVFKDYKATVQVGAKIATIDDTTVKNYQAPKKDGKVAYSVDPESSVFTWTAPDKDGVVNYSASVEALTDSQKYKTGTIRYTPVISGFPIVNGTANAKGSAFANGTSGKAFKQGDWGVKKTTTALTGELGQELVVYGNRYWTVGDNGAEFATIPKGAIVFNHKQTAELFRNGKVTSDGGRGRAFANGTAYLDNNVSGGGIFYNPSTGELPGSGSDDSSDKSEQTFDWLEVLLSRLERTIDNLDRAVNNAYDSWGNRNNNLSLEIDKNEELIYELGVASSTYLASAKAVDLDEDTKALIRNGAFIPSHNVSEETAKKIKEYQDFYEKYLDAEDKLADAIIAQSALYAQKFDHVISKYDGILQGYEHTETMLNEYISQAEAKGHIVSEKYYKALIENEKQNINTLKQEQAALIAERDKAVADNKISKYSEAWYDMCAEIDGVTQAIEEGNTALIEYSNSIRDIDWEVFDLIQERISDVTAEADFLIELMSNKDLFDDEGNFTEQGVATMGLHGQNYNTYMYQADDYGNKVKEIDAKIASGELDGDSRDVIDKRREYVELQRESILAAEDEKNAIRDLVEEGISLELDVLQEKIDKKNEELETEKDLYEYQKQVLEQTEEIASLEKQMAAYSNDDSEEAKAKIQELKVSLEEAKTELKETEWDRYIDQQSQLLDTLYTEYENILNSRLDNIDYLIQQVIDGINAAAGVDGVLTSALGADGAIAQALASNASTIGETLKAEVGAVGTKLSTDMSGIWDTEGTGNKVITKYGEGFQGQQTTTNLTLGNIKANIDRMVDDVDKDATTKVNSNKTSTSAKKDPTKTTTTTKTTSKTNKSTSGDGKPKVGDKVKFLSGKYYYDSEGVNPAGSKNHGKQVYITNINTKSWATHPYHISTGKKLGSGDLGWLKLNQISGYAIGKKNFLDDEIAWTQENGREFIVRPSDGAILTPVAKGDSVLTSTASNNIWDMANSPADFIKDNLHLGTANVPNNSTVSNSYSQHIDNVVFRMDNVKNYEELLYALKDDRRFEKLVTAMTINRIAGGSSLAKGKSIR